MSIQVISLIGLAVALIIYLFYRRYIRKQKIKSDIIQHINHIRQHQVLIKPEKLPNTFSGKFAGRRLQFSFKDQLEIQAELIADLDTDSVWIYPTNHPFTDSKFSNMLEKNRAWTGNTNFDTHYILAGHPRHFANAIMQPAKRVQSQLLTYPHSAVVVDSSGVMLQPNPKQSSAITPHDWREWMGLISDIAQYTEAQCEAPMFAGIAVDESATPNHQSEHVN
jgi:hypothetical protein